jgi:hypothetical protein
MDCGILVAGCLMGMSPVNENKQHLTSFTSQGENEHENKTTDGPGSGSDFCNHYGR